VSGFHSRAHGFDLYAERARLGFHPYQAFQIKHATAVHAVSERGKRYLSSLHKQAQNIERSYLGTADNGMSEYQPAGRIHILSCSSIISLKRVELIADLFCQTGDKVDWTHIGAGDAFDIEAEVRPRLAGRDKKLTVTGSMGHADVLCYMKNEHGSVFVNLSTTEGIPVTMMEAISMGIPIIGTNVGGVSELVTKQTGKLIEPDDIDISSLAQFIDNWEHEEMFSSDFRNGVREYWKQWFSAEKNYKLFCTQLKTVHAI
jgi:glycosyltransferase involved in cell wall biosynthesis